MKILLVSSSSGSRGGGELYLIYLGRALKNLGHEVSLWMSTHPRMDDLAAMFEPLGPVIREDYTNTYDYSKRSLAHLFCGRVARQIADRWKTLSPDVIHLNKQNLEDCLDLIAASNFCDIPSVTTIHITQTARFLRARYAPLRDWVAKRALRKYRGILVPTLKQRELELRKFLGPRVDIRTVVNGVPLPDLRGRADARKAVRQNLNIGDDALLFIGVGRVVAQKRPMLWLEWAARIAKSHPGARFLWLGEGSLATQFDRFVAEHSLVGTIRRGGWTSEVSKHLLAADIFMHTAEFEGLSFALLEALASALPIFITPNLLAELPFLIENVAVELSDKSDWQSVLHDPSRLRTLGGIARTLAEEQFSFARMAHDYEALYHAASTRLT